MPNAKQEKRNTITELLTLAAIPGNLLFIAWIFYNGVNEGFEGTTVEKFSYFTLMGLLAVNAYLIIRGRKK